MAKPQLEMGLSARKFPTMEPRPKISFAMEALSEPWQISAELF
jgi:hypothetical protein